MVEFGPNRLSLSVNIRSTRVVAYSNLMLR